MDKQREEKKPRKLTRKRCPKCDEELSNTVFNRHQNPVVCPFPATTGNVKRSCFAASHSSVHLSQNSSAAVTFQQYTATDYCSDCSEDVDAQEYSDIKEDGHPSSISMAEETSSDSTAQSSESEADEIMRKRFRILNLVMKKNSNNLTIQMM